MGAKRYSRKEEVEKFKSKIDVELLNLRLQSLFISCKIQMNVYNSIFSQSMGQDDYKSLLKEYAQSKADCRKFSKNRYS